MNNERLTHDESLDPQDWEEYRRLGHRIIDDLVDRISTLDDRPVWKHAPESIKQSLTYPVPDSGVEPERVYEEFQELVQPYLLGNNHPRFWGWVAGTGTLMGAFAELIAAADNSPSGAFSYMSANYVEKQVLGWFKQLFGYPTNSSGLLTSGCSASNLIALAVARNAMAEIDLRKSGLCSIPRRMVLYGSVEAHSSLQKAIEILGLGQESLRKVPVNGRFEIDLASLTSMIENDRKRDLLPFCVIGAAGTTNTGAVDDLEGLAYICRQENLWFHVDGAFGAWAAISPASKHLVAGMEKADSLAFDLHKWMYLPYDIGCVLVKDEAKHRQAFSLTPEYLAHGTGDRGLTGVDIPWLSDYGFQLSRSFPSLKAWMSIRASGIKKFGRMIQQNIDQAHYLEKLVLSEPELELALPVSLNVVCFRYFDQTLSLAELNELNKRIEIELQESGTAVLSTVVLKGRNYLHAAITNHRSKYRDFEILVDEVQSLGAALLGTGAANDG
jgi:glutamate/tyrosine decarboxylase-like PLP-dependent enzyme